MTKIILCVFMVTLKLVVGDKVPVYSGGSTGYNGNAAQDAFNALGEAIPGEPGEDYPIYSEVPDTSFTCDGQVEGGYYSDPEAECQAFHICGGGAEGSLIQYSFLCPNGSLFNQEYFVCDWWFNVDCSQAEDFYFLNEEIAAEREANSPGGAQGSYGGSQGRSGVSRNSGSRGSSSRSSQRSQSGSSEYSGSASNINNDYSAPSGFSADSAYGAPSGAGSDYGAPSSADSGYGAPAGASSGYGAPEQTYAGVQPARLRTGRRGGRRFGK